jgi:asparagine synthase (glutamine-hydrolysing)
VLTPERGPDRAVLERMVAALSHRGPDETGVQVVGSVGLGHSRLSIVDPSPAGRQPMIGPAGRWWITYNGEVFNHLDLRRGLPPHSYRGGSDTETLVHGLETWGLAAVPRCNGLFAFAALDLGESRLVLVRDRFGVKPLYYARNAGGLWFASEFAALFAAGVPRRPRRDILAHSLATSWANGSHTPFEGIDRLLPGAWLEVSLDTLEAHERSWYDPVEAVDPERARALGDACRDGAADLLEDLLRASVRRRLMADVPVGTMCSGGLDSSLLTAFAREAQPDIRAFNASVTDQPDRDEAPWAAQVAGALGVRLHTVRMSAATWRAELVEAVRHVEYPLAHMMCVPMAQVARLARQSGVKVLLSGEGADELLGGYSWLNPAEYADFRARGRRLESAARFAYRRLQMAGVLSPPPLWPPAGPSEEVRLYERGVTSAAYAAYAHHRGTRRRLEAALASYLRLYLPNILSQVDRSTMQHSIELRTPFLDPDVAALSLNLPLEYRAEPARKALLRTLARRHLPPGVADRPKIGFGWDVNPYLLPAVRPEFLLEGRLRDLLEVPREDWRRLMAGLRDESALLHWTGEIWCRLLVDGESTSSVEEALWLHPDRDVRTSAASGSTDEA